MSSQAPPDEVVSHWSTLIEGFQASPLAFYQAVEEALARREVPATTNTRIDYKEAGLLSPNREYLHVTREKLVFDICGAPFGTGFFVSWWLAQDTLKFHPIIKALLVIGMLLFSLWTMTQIGLVMGPVVLVSALLGVLALAQLKADAGEFDDSFIYALPMIGSLYLRLFKPATYYRTDSMTMFQKAVHNAVLEVIDAMTAEKGIRALSEDARKPIMREFYSNKVA